MVGCERIWQLSALLRASVGYIMNAIHLPQYLIFHIKTWTAALVVGMAQALAK
jgi:hypothetical protein